VGSRIQKRDGAKELHLPILFEQSKINLSFLNLNRRAYCGASEWNQCLSTIPFLKVDKGVVERMAAQLDPGRDVIFVRWNRT